MTEAEVFEGMFDALDLIISLVSLYFAIVSGYLAALYFFLGQAPFVLRLIAFGLLSISFVFLGGTAKVIETLQDGLYGSWSRLPSPTVPLERLRNPVPVESVAGLSQQEVGVLIGWAVAGLVYLSLFYLTFIYRWGPAKPD